MRRRLFACSVVALLAAGSFWPAVHAYTFAFGERATATIDGCDARRSDDFTSTACHGIWRTGDGDRGAGEIHNLTREQRRGTVPVPVRIGPMGPYANGWDRAWPTAALTATLALIPITVATWIRRKHVLPARRLAGALLGAPGDTLVVPLSGSEVRHPDGSLYATVADTGPEPAPGHRHLEVPGRRRTDRPQPALASADRLRRFRTVTDAAGRPLLHLEHRSDRGLHPEHVLLDPSGAPVLLVRDDPERAHAYHLLDVAGTVAGDAAPVEGRGGRTLELSGADAEPVATAAKDGGRWVLRVEEGAPRPLRDAALALVLIRLTVID
ncbi:hypothetical protein [Actinomadura sp. WMMB 499]|uniref:hypothetical protein n=1 Tax=Actinomadura sp. WMMB 499 TaxID=1219491 RepID=UPI001244CCDF|nr:hypothetical protein [Actinomadura sp. WMMB 499]QFG24716.1 hypothetical protein F7P10_29805 [Actinomadura sp. WMMB 499]